MLGDYGDLCISYLDLLADARGMSPETIARQLKAIQKLSDFRDEVETTAGMQAESAALTQALEEKTRN